MKSDGPGPGSWPGQVVSEADFVSGYGHGLHDVDVANSTSSTAMPSGVLISDYKLRKLRPLHYIGHYGPQPVAYMFYLDLEDFQVVGSSPGNSRASKTAKLRCRQARVRVAKRSQKDEALERDLADPKELAEHLL